MNIGKYSGQHINNPRYELKQLLILLRQINDIPLAEMSKHLDITVPKLLEYERSSKVIDEYEAIYIEVLKEYVVLAAKDKTSFENALKIYINQRSLHKYNNTYKVALFGQIMYDYFHVNMNALEEKGALTEVPKFNDYQGLRVWSSERYSTAFFMLGMLREMLGVDAKYVASNIGVTRETLRELENCTKSYRFATELYEVYKQYCIYLSKELLCRGINKNIQEVVSMFIENGYTRAVDSLKLRYMLLDELYK